MFWLLSMLATRDREEMSRTLLAMSSSQDSCIAMRRSGCVPLLVQILHDGPEGGASAAGESGGNAGCSREARSRACAALHNIIYSQPDEGQARREMRVLHVLEQIRSHSESGWDWMENHVGTPSPGGTITTGQDYMHDEFGSDSPYVTHTGHSMVSQQHANVRSGSCHGINCLIVPALSNLVCEKLTHGKLMVIISQDLWYCMV